MKELFFTLADHACAGLEGNEVLLLNFSGEVTDFVRFNHAPVSYTHLTLPTILRV